MFPPSPLVPLVSRSFYRDNFFNYNFNLLTVSPAGGSNACQLFFLIKEMNNSHGLKQLIQ